MPKKSKKSKLLPTDLQKIILEYADLKYVTKEHYYEFYNGMGTFVRNKALDYAMISVAVPAMLAALPVWKNESKPRKAAAVALGAVVALPFLAVAPLVATGTGLHNLSMFAKRKVKEAEYKNPMFDKIVEPK